MIPVFQTRINNTDGDCWPACLASYFEVPLEEVAHCHCGDEDWVKHTDEWLSKRGLYYVEFNIRDGILMTMPADGSLCILGMTNPFRHVVIGRIVWECTHPNHSCKDWRIEVVHDPSGLQESYAHRNVDRIILFAHLSR